MSYTITTTLDPQVYIFLDRQAKMMKKTKKSILEQALKQYEKQLLEQQILSGLDERYEEYRSINTEFLSLQTSSLSR